MLKRFQNDSKIAYIENHIVIRNFIKHQKINPNIQKGIDEILKDLPKACKAFQSLSKTLNNI